MSLDKFSKNLKYLRKKRRLTGSQLVRKINEEIRSRFQQEADDKLITRSRLGAYEEGRSYCPAYLLPIFCKILRHKDAISLFTDYLDPRESM